MRGVAFSEKLEKMLSMNDPIRTTFGFTISLVHVYT